MQTRSHDIALTLSDIVVIVHLRYVKCIIYYMTSCFSVVTILWNRYDVQTTSDLLQRHTSATMFGHGWTTIAVWRVAWLSAVLCGVGLLTTAADKGSCQCNLNRVRGTD